MADMALYELVGVVLGGFVWIEEAVLAVIAWRDWRGAGTSNRREVGRRGFAAAAYRAGAKFILWAILLLLLLARPRGSGLRKWLFIQHPSSVFWMLFAVLGLLTINASAELLWRWQIAHSTKSE